MIVVIEASQRSIDTAKKIRKLAHEIGVSNVLFVANKIYSSEDEKLIQNSFTNKELIGIIPFSEELRLSDRTEQSVLDNLKQDMMKCFEDILDKILTG